MPPLPRSLARSLAVIILAYFIIGAQYAALTPAWQVPDEPAHYNYIRHIAQTGSLPVLQPGDYDQAYLSTLTSEKFPPERPIDPLHYEDYAPPLYYLLATPVFLLSGGALFPLRLYSLALGAGVIAFAFLAVQELFPARPWLALTTAGFIAFIPQHVAMMAGVNSDSLAELLIAAGLWGILRASAGRLETLAREWRLGLVIGLALITKATAYILVPVAAVMLLLRWRRMGWGEWRLLLRRALLIFGPALAIGLLWWGRNLLVYGWPDFLGAIRHDAVVLNQPRTSEWIALYGSTAVAQRFAVTTFQSFWGQFGWMGVVMDGWVYPALLLYSVGLVLGVAMALVRGPWSAVRPEQRDGSILLLVSGLLTLALYLYYNLTFVQHQGRYLFPALIPIGLAAAASLWAWGRLLEKFARQRVGWIIPAGALVGMAALDLFALYRFIIPALAR
ncbi:MAG: ArnT family glycosyltransferase [Anaerolineales bacterium]